MAATHATLPGADRLHGHCGDMICDLKGEHILKRTVILGARPDHGKQKLLASGRIYFFCIFTCTLKVSLTV